MYTSIYWTTC